MEQPRIPDSVLIPLACSCGCDFFEQAFKIRHYAGGIYSPTPLFAPIPVFRCLDCKKVLTVQNKFPNDKTKID